METVRVKFFERFHVFFNLEFGVFKSQMDLSFDERSVCVPTWQRLSAIEWGFRASF